MQQTYWNDINDPEEVREMTRKIVVEILDRLMSFAHAMSLRIIFSAVSFSNTEASMRSIFNGVCAGRAVHRETEA